MYQPRIYEPTEERFNVISHGIGLILSIIGLVFLCIRANEIGNYLHLISFFVFGFSMVIIYAASTFFHNAKDLELRRRLNIIDHAAIFVFIAGTYTPYTMVTLNGQVGWWLFGVIWTIAAIGVTLKIFYTGRFNLLSTIAYVLMGWIVLFAIQPLMENLSPEGLFWLLAGGISYTIGALFFSFDSLKFNHAIFHVFVMIGSACHFISIYGYVR